MWHYTNQNPLGKRVEDCVVRAISLAQGKEWDVIYKELSEEARKQGTLLNDSVFVESYLNERYDKVCYRCKHCKMTVHDFIKSHRAGTYLVTMQGHITCIIDGELHDTWDCSDRKIWCAWLVKG